MDTTYIQFEAPKRDHQILKDGLIKSSFKKALVSVLTKFIPKANPDFEDKIDEVQYWLVECNNDTGIPEREIGLDKNRQVILKMPFKDNYGYWTDNNLLLNDFKEHFVVSEISKESFEQSWERLDKVSDLKIGLADYKMLTRGLTKDQFKNTFDKQMVDVTETAAPVVDIWPYVEQLTRDKVVLNYVLDKQLVETVYRNSANTFDHILLPTDNKNIFIVIVIDLKAKQIMGHIKLDLEQEYGLK